MKRLAILALALLLAAPLAAQTNVSSKWVNGNLVYYDTAGNIIVTIDGANRKLTLPSGAVLDISGATGSVTFAAGEIGPTDIANNAISAPHVGQSIGALTAANASAVERIGALHASTFTFTVTGTAKVTLADGDHGGGKKFYDFPEGEIYIVGAVLDATVTNTANFNAHAADTFYFGIGTALAGDDADLTGTEQDIIAKQTVDTVGGTTLTRAEQVIFATPAFFDGTGGAKTLNVNFAIPAANNTDANDFTCTGTMTLLWALVGDK